MAGTVSRAALWAACLLLLGGAAAHAESIEELNLRFESGYRVDEIDWSIAGGGIDVLSELEWEDLEIYQLRAAGSLTLERGDFPHFASHLRGSAGYGWIVDGDNRDSDYAGPGRTQEFSRSENSSDDGDVLDLSIGLGPRFRFLDDTLALTPLFGLSYHEQNLEITDGFQTVSVPVIFPPFIIVPPDVGPFAGLDSSYETKWRGPWLGLDVDWHPAARFTLSGSAEYHWADYEAEADWNLRSDFAHPKSFEHEADGSGVVLSVAAAFDLSDSWALRLSADYQEWETDAGTDRVFFSDGSIAESRLNEVNWQSSAANFGVVYRLF